MAEQSTLADLHNTHGAALAEYDGWLLPAHYGDSTAEYHAVRSAVGLIDFSHRALLQLTGPDRLNFLQGMVSNDLRSVKPYEGLQAAFLNQQGKVLADVRVLCSENSLYLDLWHSLKEKIIAHLNRYLVADEVDIADRSKEYAILSLQGPRAEALLEALVGKTPLPAQYGHHVMVRTGDTAICAVRANHTGEDGIDLITPRAELLNLGRRLGELGKAFSSHWVGQEAMEILRIEAGSARYGIDFSEDNLLLETGLETHVSFDKGCYLGQEIVERVRSRGHVNRRLCGLLIDGRVPARSGDTLHVNDKTVGAITSSTYSPRLDQGVALGYVHRDHWQFGTVLTVKGQTRELIAKVTDLPFVKPSA